MILRSWLVSLFGRLSKKSQSFSRSGRIRKSRQLMTPTLQWKRLSFTKSAGRRDDCHRLGIMGQASIPEETSFITYPAFSEPSGTPIPNSTINVFDTPAVYTPGNTKIIGGNPE